MGCGKSKADPPMSAEEKKKAQEEKIKKKKEMDEKKKQEAEAKKAEADKKKAEADAEKKNKEEEKKAATGAAKAAKEVIDGKKVKTAAKKGAKERPASDFVQTGAPSDGNTTEASICQDSKTGGLVICFPLNAHDNAAIDQCEKLLKLNHENVISHNGYYRNKWNELFMAAELPLLANLHTRVRSKKYIKKYFSAIDACKILSRVTEGLSYCHDQKVAHRDIKVGNIFYTEDNLIKLGNFLLDYKTPKLEMATPAK
jgi:serine/threonine protein kinase